MIKKISVIVALVVLAVYGFHLADFDDRIWYYLQDISVSKEVKDRSVWLPAYQADVIERQIPGVAKNASGITYDRDRKTLWIVVNRPTFLLELDIQLNLVRRIELKNFYDTEAIAYVGNGYFIVSDERDQTIALAHIDEQTKSLDKNILQHIVINIHGHSNKGLEGVAADFATQTIYAVRERDPMKVIKVRGFLEKQNRITIETLNSIDANSLHLDDLSGLHFDSTTNHLLVLSHESRMLAEIDLEGNLVSSMDLEKGFNNLNRSILQAEGVTLDEKGNLYIVSEPNLIYRFRKE